MTSPQGYRISHPASRVTYPGRYDAGLLTDTFLDPLLFDNLMEFLMRLHILFTDLNRMVIEISLLNSSIYRIIFMEEKTGVNFRQIEFRFSKPIQLDLIED